MNKGVGAFVEALERQGIAIGSAGMPLPIVEKLATARLRFDREALRFVADVESALSAAVPAGKTLVFAITAPIRLAGKTVDALEEKLRSALARAPARLELDETINGNRIRVRLAKGGSNRKRAIGFVHNPDCDPNVLFDATQSVLRLPPPA
ncbi:MAG TPA: hypothetical protein VF835_01420 [Rhizomicrobium sp.]